MLGSVVQPPVCNIISKVFRIKTTQCRNRNFEQETHVDIGNPLTNLFALLKDKNSVFISSNFVFLRILFNVAVNFGYCVFWLINKRMSMGKLRNDSDRQINNYCEKAIPVLNCFQNCSHMDGPGIDRYSQQVEGDA